MLLLSGTDRIAVALLLARYGIDLRLVAAAEPIPGSYWRERGRPQGGTLNARLDTPLHSILHEACHYVCMDAARRSGLATDAGGDYDEENAVCYLQVLLAGQLPGFGR
jgi:hypothetical protein